MNKYYIFDFDSTIINCEALDELASIALRNRLDRDQVVAEIKNITNLGMEGKVSFSESLNRRFKLLAANKEHIDELVGILKNRFTKSILDNKEFFIKNADFIYVITGGFRDYVLPVISNFGIAEEHILANEFIFNEKGDVVGYNKNNPLSRSGGKAEAVKGLNLSGEVIVIGDGYSDYEIKAGGAAHKFIAFTENVRREKVVERADITISDFKEIINGI